MKILFATSEVPPTPSGMARVAARLIEGFRARGHAVEVLAAERLPRVTYADVRIAPLAPHWLRVRRLARQADVISLHGPVPTFSDFFLLMKATDGGLPPLVYSHHMDVRFRRWRAATDAYGALYGRLMERADAVLVATEAAARGFGHGTLGPRPQVAPYGIDLERVLPRRTDVPFNALFVGQLRPYKGVDVLLEAWRLLPDVPLRIAGRGYAEPEYRAMAARLHLRNVEFLGAVSDDELWQLRAESTLSVIPSTEMEYFGLATLEAMAAGCVPVITDLPGPAEVVGESGRVVPAHDAGALAAAVAGLRDDPAETSRLGRCAEARARRYSWERYIDQHLGLYEALI